MVQTAHNTETILQTKMIGFYQKTLGVVAFQPQFFPYNTYMNFIRLKNVYGLNQILTLIYVDIQAVDSPSLDIPGGILL